jgi:hypothetical protein
MMLDLVLLPGMASEFSEEEKNLCPDKLLVKPFIYETEATETTAHHGLRIKATTAHSLRIKANITDTSAYL